MKISLWATHLGAPKPNMDAWLATVEAKLVAAKAEGSSLLVMPEYACAQWLSFAAVDLHKELRWLADAARVVLPTLHALVERHGVGLLAGTMPTRVEDGFVNRAMLLVPEGTFVQDKLALTPWERDPAGWLLTPGTALRVAHWRGLRIAIAICLDIEVPSLSARMSALDLDLLIVPSMTSSRAGYERVFGCAKARAVECACPVAAVGAVGTLRLPDREESNASGAALFVPCEPQCERGIAGSIGPFHLDGDDGPVLHIEVPIDECRRLRRGGSEVWPPRAPVHLVVEESAVPSPR